MKNLKYLILSVVLTISCSDDFLEVKSESLQTTIGFFKTEQDIELAVIGAYDFLQSKGTYGLNFTYFMEVHSDNSTVQDGNREGGRYSEFSNFIVEPTNLLLAPTWTACYKGIQRCNTVLNRIGDIEMNQQLKNKRIGEVKFIRALTYFNMVRIWGDVPLVIKETEDPFESFGEGRTPANEVYDQIIQDLTDALKMGLPNSDTSGRVSHIAVETLLGKVFLTLKQYLKATQILQAVVDSNSHKLLLSDFADVFAIANENVNTESIFEIQFASTDDEGSRFSNTFIPRDAGVLVGGVGSAIGDNLPTENLYNEYSSGDLRRDASIGVFDDGSFYSKKFLDNPSTENNSNRNSIVLRYADVLLMLSEALNEIKYVENGLAFSFLNQIRKRAGLSDVSSTDLTDQNMFREEIYLQRRLELAHENHRWFDLVRTGKAIEVISNNKGIVLTEKDLLFPIPQDAIDQNPDGLTQNMK